MKRKLIIACFVVPILAGALLIIHISTSPWSPINCWTYQVDINSGQIRYTRYLCLLPVKRTVEESTLSHAAGIENFRSKNHDWHNVLTLSPGVGHSPHYVYHSAINQIRQLEGIWQLGKFTQAARRSSALRILTLWQEGKNDGAASDYLRALSVLAMRKADEDKSTDEKDLPKYN